jgi:hypothetical protein
MKRFIFAAAVAASTAPALAANVGVSVVFGQPGYYGHIDIGNFPQPPGVRVERVVRPRIAASTITGGIPATALP